VPVQHPWVDSHTHTHTHTHTRAHNFNTRCWLLAPTSGDLLWTSAPRQSAYIICQRLTRWRSSVLYSRRGAPRAKGEGLLKVAAQLEPNAAGHLWSCWAAQRSLPRSRPWVRRLWRTRARARVFDASMPLAAPLCARVLAGCTCAQRTAAIALTAQRRVDPRLRRRRGRAIRTAVGGASQHRAAVAAAGRAARRLRGAARGAARGVSVPVALARCGRASNARSQLGVAERGPTAAGLRA
jgi:hypothetical protein